MKWGYMQNNENGPLDNNAVSNGQPTVLPNGNVTQPIGYSNPVAANVYNQNQPVNNTQYQPVQSQTVSYATEYSGGTSGYLETLKAIVTKPQEYFSNEPNSFLKSLIFPVINLVVMLVVLIITSIISIVTAPIPTYLSDTVSPFSKLTGDFWGELFKNAGLSALFAVIFLAAIAGIIYLSALIAKKNVSYNYVLSICSIFSLNFLAGAVVSIIALLNVWVSNADFNSIISQIIYLITSLVFVYAIVLIIQGVNQLTGFSLAKSTVIIIASSIIILFIGGKIVKEFPANFNVSFGGYSNSVSSSSSSAASAIDALKQYFSL